MENKILIVDDNAFMRRMLKDILENNGFQVVGEAGNGQEAINLYQQLKPDLVTMDITMPDMDGVEAVENILNIDPNARIIMVSAMNQRIFVMKAIQLGAKDYVTKPFQQERILQSIKRVLAR